MRWLLKRSWFWPGAAFMLVAVCAGYLLIPVGGSKAKYGKIHVGMEASDVEDLLGGNVWFDWTEIEWTHDERCEAGRWLRTGTLFWNDEDGNTIQVTFGRSRVTGKSFTPTTVSFQELMKLRIKRSIRPLWP